MGPGPTRLASPGKGRPDTDGGDGARTEASGETGPANTVQAPSLREASERVSLQLPG